jgi:hypothetical protein
MTVICPESTIESSDRRNFIRKAVALSAAAGVGGILLSGSGSIIPQSSAASYAKTAVTTDTVSSNASGRMAVFDGESDVTGAVRSSSVNLCGSVCFNTGLLNVKNINGCGIYGTGNSCGGAGVVGFGCVGVIGNGECFAGVWGNATGIGVGVKGCSSCAGVCGTSSGCAPGVRGRSAKGPGIEGQSSTPVSGMFQNVSCAGLDKTTLIQFENGCCTPVDWYAGVSGQGNSYGLHPGQFFLETQKQPRFVVTACGKVGIGTIAPATTLDVKGGVSAKTRIVTSSYSVKTSDFAIFANASSGGFAIKLPPASTAGMIVHVKKIDSSSNGVTVERSNSDTIEGAKSMKLLSRYQSLTLIAGGDGFWYLLSTAT